MNEEHAEESGLRIEIGEPRWFTYWRKIVALALIAVGVALPLAFLLRHTPRELAASFWYWYSPDLVLLLFGLLLIRLGLIPVVGLPLFLLTEWQTSALRRECGEHLEGKESLLAVVTLDPRRCRGLEAIISDGDDLGYLMLGDDHLLYLGDAVQLRIPYARLTQVELAPPPLLAVLRREWRVRLDFEVEGERQHVFFAPEAEPRKKGSMDLVTEIHSMVDVWMIRTGNVKVKRLPRPERRLPFHKEASKVLDEEGE